MLARSGGMEIAMEQEKKAWLVLADGTVLEGASSARREPPLEKLYLLLA